MTAKGLPTIGCRIIRGKGAATGIYGVTIGIINPADILNNLGRSVEFPAWGERRRDIALQGAACHLIAIECGRNN